MGTRRWWFGSSDGRRRRRLSGRQSDSGGEGPGASGTVRIRGIDNVDYDAVDWKRERQMRSTRS